MNATHERLVRPSPAAIRYTASSPVPPLPERSLAGRRILFALAPSGHAVQEALIPADLLARAGAEIAWATIGGAAIRFDPVCNAMAVAEPWAPALGLWLRSGKDASLGHPYDLRALADDALEALLDRFDAIVVPGGHGSVFARFTADPLLGRALAGVHERGGVVALACHGVLAGASAIRADGRALIAGHEVTCWPARYERPLAKIPLLGSYFAPYAHLVEEGVRDAGAVVVDRADAVVHDRIVTTWGPWTGAAFGRAIGGVVRSNVRQSEEPLPARPVDVATIPAVRRRVWTNWGRTFSCRPVELASPRSTDEVAALVARAARDGRGVRPVGSGYSYTRLAQTDATMIRLDRLTGIEHVDPEARVVRVRAGTPLYELTRMLAKIGLAVPTSGDIDRQTVAGLVATATHGSSLQWGSFSSLVAGLTLVDGLGRIHEIRGPDLRFAACSLGALGIVTHVDLNVVPHYHLAVHRWPSTVAEMRANLLENARQHRNFESFWFAGTDTVSNKSMDLTAPAPGETAFGRFFNEIVIENGLGWAASEGLRKIPGLRPYLEALAPHVVVEETSVRPAEDAYATPRWVKHQEVEYALPLDAADSAIGELEALMARYPSPTIFPFEIRFAPGEDLPLSPSYRRDTVWMAAHTYVKEDHRDFFDRCEAIFRAHAGRPHWGKLHHQSHDELVGRYPELAAFAAVRDRFDPERRFGSPYLTRILGA